MAKWIINKNANEKTVEAETYRIEAGFVTFYDDTNSPIASFPQVSVISVEREGVVQQD